MMALSSGMASSGRRCPSSRQALLYSSINGGGVTCANNARTAQRTGKLQSKREAKLTVGSAGFLNDQNMLAAGERRAITDQVEVTFAVVAGYFGLGRNNSACLVSDLCRISQAV